MRKDGLLLLKKKKLALLQFPPGRVPSFRSMEEHFLPPLHLVCLKGRSGGVLSLEKLKNFMPYLPSFLLSFRKQTGGRGTGQDR